MTGSGAELTVEAVELYIHRSGSERVVLRQIERGVQVRQAVDLADGERVWLQESLEEVDVSVTIEEAGLPHRGHLHVNRCHEVDTSVVYNGQQRQHPFHPATRVEAVFDWAVSPKGFNLTPEDAAEHTLQISGTNVQPDASDHIGSFVDGACSVTLSLVPKIRNQG